MHTICPHMASSEVLSHTLSAPIPRASELYSKKINSSRSSASGGTAHLLVTHMDIHSIDVRLCVSRVRGTSISVMHDPQVRNAGGLRDRSLHVLVLQRNPYRLRILQPLHGARAGGGYEVEVLSEDLRERGLARRDAVLGRDRSEPVGDLEILGELLCEAGY
ncbi:hypothetical protein DAEQUDRAFT_153467 [Daedalea quercina L-15889]|uniref:Uncharacterized protein n=1 Tax=Daedalea quercina L-15889 TaxID=1314783 RepID=A0A165RMD9_9APHY|nr:hypothetical protein DAEQUDRAFT_153467 [Daedalea quercina L-15889]